MDRQVLIEKARAAMAERKSMLTREKGYLFHHGLRTAKLAMTLMQRVGQPVEASPDALFAAALFHDIGKGIDPHNEIGAVLTAELIKDVCASEEIAEITRLVRMHNQRGRPGSTAAGKVLQDADILDHFGTQGVWMAFHWNAVQEETPWQSLEYFHSPKNNQWIADAGKALNFQASREVLAQRVAFEKSFYDLFERQLEGER